MLRLDVLRLSVDRRLTAVTDDIFRCFAGVIAEYEREVSRLKLEADRQGRLPGAAGGPEDRPAGTLQDFTAEEQQVRGRSISPHLKREEDGASGPPGTHTKFTQSPDWLRERPETNQSPSSNQTQSCRQDAGPQPAVNKQEVPSVKQEVDEGYTVPEAAVRAQISCQQEAILQASTTEEEQQVRGGGLSLHIKQEKGGASGPEETVTKFTLSPQRLMEHYEDEQSPSSNHVKSHREEDLLLTQSYPLIGPEPGWICIHTEHNRDSTDQSKFLTDDSDDAQMEPGLCKTQGTRTRLPVDQKLLVCRGCGREFSSRSSLRKHIRTNTGRQDQDRMSCSLRRQRAPFQISAKSFSCRICRRSFSTQGILVRHAQNHCKEPENRCGACGDLLESTEVLRKHLRSHKELGSTCDVCGKKCNSMKRMEIHKRVHTGEKPYCCGLCSRDFSRKESLERHLKVHTKERPHHCGLCRRTFTRREYLVHHLKTDHTERPGPPVGNEPISMKL